MMDRMAVKDVTFNKVMMQGASLKYINMSAATMNDVNLTGANLEGAVFNFVSMRGVNLTGANLRGIKYDQTSLCALSRSRLDGAIMDAGLKADLANSKGVCIAG